MRVLLLFILLWPCFVLAQGVPYLAPSLLEQAYNNMLAGNYAAAESQYFALSTQEPHNHAAWEGLLWAQNALGKYHATLKLSHQLVKQQEMQGAMYNYLAFAYLQSKRPSEARYYYQLGYRLDPQNPLGNQISQEGMAYAYLALGDYPHFYEQLNRSTALSGIPAPKPKLVFQTTLSYNAPAKNKKAYGIGQSIAYRSWKLSGAYDDFRISNTPFRNVLKAELGKQCNPLDIAVSGRTISGDDERVYPAKQVGLVLSPKLYPGIFALKPQVFASYSHYPRFD
ncbi:MAG: hypothetical protein RBS43_06470, partial [Candidatus Cloacimonas sp.]|nr:hypothetical protein [Candidatus Cloacimonas sp.]